MKTTKFMFFAGALAALAGCAETSGPFRALHGPVAVAPQTCTDFQTSVYFDQDSAVLTREARMALDSAKSQARGCLVRSVKVTGLADAVGAPPANLALSRRRAETVSKALSRAGFAKVDFDLEAVGAVGSLATSGAAAPLRRRADVQFDLEPR